MTAPAALRMRLLALPLVALGLLLGGCGTAAVPVAKPVATPSPALVSADPSMVMVTLADAGFRSSTIDVSAGTPVMFMVVNKGTRTHSVAATLPLRGLASADATASAAPAAAGPGSGFSVAVAPGHEVDVSFSPTAPGRYSLIVDGRAAALLAVAA